MQGQRSGTQDKGNREQLISLKWSRNFELVRLNSSHQVSERKGDLLSLHYICWVEFPFQVLLSSSLSSCVRSLQILPSFLKSLGRFSRLCLERVSLSGHRGKWQSTQLKQRCYSLYHIYSIYSFSI